VRCRTILYRTVPYVFHLIAFRIYRNYSYVSYHCVNKKFNRLFLFPSTEDLHKITSNTITFLIFNKKKNIGNSIYFYFFLIPIAYLLGLVNLFIDTPNEKNMEFFYHFTFILQMINTLVILNNFSKIDGVDEAILLKVNLLLIFIYTAIVFITFDFSLKVEYNLNFFNFKTSTNINGICRMLSIINIFITCNYFIKKKKYYAFDFSFYYKLFNNQF